MNKYLLIALALWLGLMRPAMAEHPDDTYPYRSECPAVGGSFPTDPLSNFYKCQCTSYVAHKLNERWGNTSPRFTNQYYGFTTWSDAYKWLDRALSSQAEIGVTGARDNFVWEESKFNAAFPGDVALWIKKTGYPFGHVAYVEAAGADAYGKGVAWVTVSEYNITPYSYSSRTLKKGDPNFPDYFLHIDKDRVYCRANPTVDTCRTLMNRTVASSGSKYVGGLGGVSSDPFNLKINSFIVTNASGVSINPDMTPVNTGDVLTAKVQVKAKEGNTSTHMRPGKSRIEVDLYYRSDEYGEWIFAKREYIKATNLPSGATHTENLTVTVPAGIRTISFKAKIDAEDEAYEANEGDNWTPVLTYWLRRTPEQARKFMQEALVIIND